MHPLAIYCDHPADAGSIRQLERIFELRFRRFTGVPTQAPELYTVIDTSLKDPSRLPRFKDWVAKKPKGGKVIFVVDRGSRLEEMRAFSIGASHLVHRPIKGRELLAAIWGEFAAIGANANEFRAECTPGVLAAFDALQNVFSAACFGAAPDPEAINAAGDQVVSQIDSQGLAGWIDTVRRHHSQTYQHCLLVTGLAVGFGQQLGLNHTDRMRLSFAGLLHDIGKARIPISILEKPSALDRDELAIMRNHPQLGFEALTTVPGLQPEMLDMVLHHHEHLDGSGYPDGLQGGEISDLVRIMTIADVFGALIENRSYKPPLSGEAAFQILLDMGPKLDRDLVREFRPVAQLGQRQAA